MGNANHNPKMKTSQSQSQEGSDNEIKTIENYQYHRADLLGKGSFGVVYRGRNTKTNEDIAIKVIPAMMFEKNPALTGMLKAEIGNMARVAKDCSHIVKLLDVKRTRRNLYLILELCSDGSLDQYIYKRTKGMTEAEVFNILRQLLKAFETLQRHKIVHRDLKLQNILLHHGVLKLADFGFSRLCEETERMNTLVGSPLYTAPQILKGERYTSKCDIWSIGVLTYYLLYTVFPWLAKSPAELANTIFSTPLSIPDTPPTSDAAKDLVRRMLSVSEDKRISWEELFAHPLIAPAESLNNAAASVPPEEGMDLTLSIAFTPNELHKIHTLARARRSDSDILDEASRCIVLLSTEKRNIASRAIFMLRELEMLITIVKGRRELFQRLSFLCVKYYACVLAEFVDALYSKRNVLGVPEWYDFANTQAFTTELGKARAELGFVVKILKRLVNEMNSLRNTSKREKAFSEIVNEDVIHNPAFFSIMGDVFTDLYQSCKVNNLQNEQRRRLDRLLDFVSAIVSGIPPKNAPLDLTWEEWDLEVVLTKFNDRLADYK
eukprot:TRINITY_DN8458_c0_g1_i1.p1 TRINITY_DN8458_c0_g1~~TRINITY_DN8458_c0_g1_i1.p1  ORF type:complete len:549 (+),score=107.64 TRINITY_DN8458_c0_g1_i1:94-1740(+)